MHQYEASMKLPDKDCRVKVKFKVDFFDGRDEIVWWLPKTAVQAFWRRDKAGSETVWWRWIESFEVLHEVE